MSGTGQSLSGKWKGHYVNVFDFRTGEPGAVGDHEFPIQATFSGTGNQFSGRMTDLITERSYPYRMIVEGEAAARMSAKELVAAKRLLLQSPRLHVDTKMPSRSFIAGKVGGSEVAFTKTYDGPVNVRWTMDNGAVYNHVKKRHQVLYRGTISGGGKVISGSWMILKPGLAGFFGAKAVEGTFTLLRDDEHETA